MHIPDGFPLLADFKNRLKQSIVTAALAEQVDMLVARYGLEYATLAEKILSTLGTMGYDPVSVAQQYICDYLLQMQHFLKTGGYGHDNYDEIKENIYHNAAVMLQTYMPGLFWAYGFTTILYTKYHLFKTKFLPLVNAGFCGVEVGFGEGFYLWELHNQIPGAKFTGFDLSEHAKIFATRLFNLANIPAANYELLFSDITAGMPAANGSYDFGILAEVIEHIQEPRQGVGELARLLKPGAPFYLTTVIDSNHMDHITNFDSPETVEKMLAAAGFAVIDRSVYRIQDDFPNTKDISVGLAFVCRKK